MKLTTRQHTSERGIALLITLLVMTVLLGISSSLLNVTLKQFQFSAIGLQSEIAFQAANAGIECILYHDYQSYPDSRFDVMDDGTGVPYQQNVLCMGTSADDDVGGDGSPTSLVNNINDEVESGEEQRFQFSWGTAPEVCSEVSIYKFSNAGASESMAGALGRPGTCAAGVVCTVVRSRGYNVACEDITNARTIERELTQRY